MPLSTLSDTLRSAHGSGVRSVLLFVFATALLMLMLLVIAPSLALPLAAFVAMAAVTRHLGLRLYTELTQALDQNR